MAEITPEEYEEFGEEPLYINDNFSNVVIVDNIPVVDMAKYEKLSGVIRNIFSGYGKVVTDGFYLPVDKDGKKTLGYAFIEYETEEMAKSARGQGDNKRLDKKHTLRVTLWNQFDEYLNTPDNYVPPKKAEFDSKATLSSWLLDKMGRDQFVVRYGKETMIYWNDPHRRSDSEGRELQYGGEREKREKGCWTESWTAWSPKGSYLATFHTPGILIWGGDKFERLGRFMHPNVNVISWSPNEKYLVTSNGKERTSKDQPWCIQIWDIRTGKLARGFDRGDAKSWPAFKWSSDDRFFAKWGKDTISVYESPSMGLLDKKSLKIEGVQNIEWSPRQHILAYWVPEMGQSPAKVALVELPSRKVIREKHLFSVSDVKMHWQSNGDYLCVKMARKKTKKTVVQNFEIFRLKDKNIPVEVLEIEDVVIAFAWEPKGHRFAIIHGNPARPDVSFYKLKNKSLEKMKTLTARPANCLFWSPTGDYIVLAGLGEKNGQLDFVDTSDWTTTTSTEHVMCNDVAWDPSGRFVITSVTQPINVDQHNFRATMENGYKLWTCSGEPLQSVSTDQFYQVLWRPRPPSILPPEKYKEVKNNLKDKYWKIFEAEDEEIRQSQLSGAAKERLDWKLQWKAFRERARERHAAQAGARQDLRGGVPSDDEDDYEETTRVTSEEVSCITTYL